MEQPCSGVAPPREGRRQEVDLRGEAGSPIVEAEKRGAVESQAAIRWNDTRRTVGSGIFRCRSGCPFGGGVAQP
jgi:hypothetical protein